MMRVFCFFSPAEDEAVNPTGPQVPTHVEGPLGPKLGLLVQMVCLLGGDCAAQRFLPSPSNFHRLAHPHSTANHNKQATSSR